MDDFNKRLELLEIKIDAYRVDLLKREEAEVSKSVAIDNLKKEMTKQKEEFDEMKKTSVSRSIKASFAGGLLGLALGYLPFLTGMIDYVILRGEVVAKKNEVEDSLESLKTGLKTLGENQATIERLNNAVETYVTKAEMLTTVSDVNEAMKPYNAFKSPLAPKLSAEGTLQVKSLQIDGVDLSRRTMKIGPTPVEFLDVSLPLKVKQRIVVTENGTSRVELMDKGRGGANLEARNGEEISTLHVHQLKPEPPLR